VAPAVSYARAAEVFRALPFQFDFAHFSDPLTAHPTTSLRISGVPRPYRLGHMCFGKGATLDHALASAACEGVERVTTWPRDGEVTLDVSARELDAMQVPRLDPRVLPLPGPGRAGYVAYNEDLILSWVPAWCLLAQAPILVPRTLTHLLAIEDTKQLFIDNRPNGSASGNTLTEAILHALYELIERDALCIGTYHALPAREIEPAHLGPEAAAVYAAFVSAGVEIRMRDCTTDIGVPVVYAYAHDREGGADRGPVHSWGAGSHLDVRLAAERAIFELVQDHAIAARDIGGGVELPDTASEETRNDRRRYRKGVEDWFAHLNRMGGNALPRDVRPVPANPADELAVVLECLKQAGVRHVAVADLTTYCKELPVVRVICPELTFMPWAVAAEKASGRLLEAPARQGYVPGRDFDTAPRVPPQALVV
jgi:ribosomal protein S12 methylthiotransferase accessory factor